MKCCNFLGGEIRETRAAGNGSLATLSLNWLQISIVMQILLLRKILPLARFRRKISPRISTRVRISSLMIHELSRESARGWYLRTAVVKLMSIPGTLVSQENMQFRQRKQAGKAAIKCKFLFHVSSPAIVPDKFRRLLPHDVDKSQLATSLSLNSLSQNQVIRPNPHSHSRNEHLAGVLFVSQHPLLCSPKHTWYLSWEPRVYSCKFFFGRCKFLQI